MPEPAMMPELARAIRLSRLWPLVAILGALLLGMPAGAMAAATSGFDFEDGTTQGWGVSYGPGSAANSTAEGFKSVHSLALAMSGAPGNPGFSSNGQVSGIAAGTQITYHLYEPTGAQFDVVPYVVDGSGAYKFMSTSSPVPGSWTTITFTVPSLSGGLGSLGIQVPNGAGAKGTIYLDAVTAPASVPAPVGDPGTWHTILDEEFNDSYDGSIWSSSRYADGQIAGSFNPATSIPRRPAWKTKSWTSASSSSRKAVPAGRIRTRPASSLQTTSGRSPTASWKHASGSLGVRRSPTWAAFWAVGKTWPQDGEIGAVEGLGGKACWHFHYAGGPSGQLGLHDIRVHGDRKQLEQRPSPTRTRAFHTNQSTGRAYSCWHAYHAPPTTRNPPAGLLTAPSVSCKTP